jgi:predicted transcriptional regulator YheO
MSRETKLEVGRPFTRQCQMNGVDRPMDNEGKDSKASEEKNLASGIPILLPASERPILGKREVMDLLKNIGLALTSMFGESCEVVLHDTGDLEHSIVWTEGDVTGRKVGDMMPDVALERLRRGEVHPLFNYTVHTESGKTLRSCRIWLRDSRNRIYGAFCVNLDVTPIMSLRESVLEYTRHVLAPSVDESYPQVFHDLGDMLDTLIAEGEYRVGKTVEEMGKEERLDLVRLLEERGAFQVRNSAAIVASRLGVTRKTIYNYLSEIAQDREEGADSY